MKNYKFNNTLYMAVSFKVADYHIGRALSEEEFNKINEVALANSEYINLAKSIVNSNPKYSMLNDMKKVELATSIVEYLKDEEKNKETHEIYINQKVKRFLI